MGEEALIIATAEEEVAIANIEQAVLDGNAEEAEKLASDLFSGSPENNLRRFQLVNEAMAGIGHTIQSANADTPAKREKRTQQRRAQDAVFRALTDYLQKRTQEIHQKLADIERQIRTLVEEIEKLEKQNTFLKAEMERITEEGLKPVNEDIASITENLARANNNLTAGIAELNPETRTTLNALRETAGQIVTIKVDFKKLGFDLNEEIAPPRRHPVYQDDNGEYYIKHPETGKELYVKTDLQNDRIETQFGDGFTLMDDINHQVNTLKKPPANEVDPSLVEKYHTDYEAYLNSLPEGDARASIVAFFDQTRELSIELEKLETSRKAILAKLEGIKNQIIENEQGIAKYRQDITDLEQQRTDLLKELEDLEKASHELNQATQKAAEYAENTRERLHSIKTKFDEFLEDGELSAEEKEGLLKLDRVLSATRAEDNSNTIIAELLIARHETQTATSEHTKAVEDESIVKEDTQEIIEEYDVKTGFSNRHQQLHEKYGFGGSGLLSKIPFSSYVARVIAPNKSIQIEMSRKFHNVHH